MPTTNHELLDAALENIAALAQSLEQTLSLKPGSIRASLFIHPWRGQDNRDLALDWAGATLRQHKGSQWAVREKGKADVSIFYTAAENEND